jgi:hypothetical protein
LGYVGIAAEQYYQILEEELKKMDLSGTDSKTIKVAFSVAIDNASQRIAKVIRSLAPVDSGELRSQIQMVDTDESDLLSAANAESDGTFIL